jgi:uncharacterized damage-inducible protein DinB
MAINGAKGLLLASLEQAYDRQSWHGTNLRGSIRRMTLEQLCWRPGAGRHNIWEIVVHAAYWKYAVRRRLTGEKRGSFPLKGSNWFARPVDASESAWREDLLLLQSAHESVREAIMGMTDRQLLLKPRGSTHTHAFVISGLAAHDVYHAGQIQLLKRLFSARSQA